MVYLTIVLSVFLFYQFVPWKHKVITFKIVGTLGVLMIIAIGGFSAYSTWEAEQKKKWITAGFISFEKKRAGKSVISINICNNNSKALLSYELHVAGLKDERSTKYKIIKDVVPAGETTLEADYIIAPGKCRVMTWTANFKKFPKYSVRPSSYMNSWEK